MEIKRLAVLCLSLLALSCGGIRPPNPTPTPTPTPTPVPTPIPPPGPVCDPAAGQHCGCWHWPPTSLTWVYACCVPWLPEGVVSVPDPAQCPVEPPPPPTCETDPRLCPPPPTSVTWHHDDPDNPSDDSDCVVRVPAYTDSVRAAQVRVPLIPGENEHTYYPRLCNAGLRPVFDCALYGEELAVAQNSGFSENYDLIFGNGNSRPAAYASTCNPATRTEAIRTTPPTSYPRPVAQVRAKVHLSAAERPGAGICPGSAILDGVALTCELACAPRSCCPACGPEGTPGREQCDRGLNPVWQGGEVHPTNPWLRCARPGVSAKVCVDQTDAEGRTRTVCSDWTEGR